MPMKKKNQKNQKKIKKKNNHKMKKANLIMKKNNQKIWILVEVEKSKKKVMKR